MSAPGSPSLDIDNVLSDSLNNLYIQEPAGPVPHSTEYGSRPAQAPPGMVCTKVVYDSRALFHISPPRHVEQASRVLSIFSRLRTQGLLSDPRLVSVSPSAYAPRAALRGAHDAAYLRLIQALDTRAPEEKEAAVRAAVSALEGIQAQSAEGAGSLGSDCSDIPPPPAGPAPGPWELPAWKNRGAASVQEWMDDAPEFIRWAMSAEAGCDAPTACLEAGAASTGGDASADGNADAAEADVEDFCMPLDPAKATRLVCVGGEMQAFSKVVSSALTFVDGDRDTYASVYTPAAAALAAGGAMRAVDALCQGEAVNAFAIVRPPGHHCHTRKALGFCLINNVAVALRYAQARYGVRRVAVVDWDIHHGDGTQEIVDADPSVLFVSLHRHDNGNFYPGTGGVGEVGSGAAEGTKVNLPWPSGGMGDEEYQCAFERLVLPVLKSFAPEMIFVSCGFDATDGDLLGGCLVTPAQFGFMTRALAALDPPKGLLLVLEGGYNLQSIALAGEACMRGLLSAGPDSVRYRSAHVNDEGASEETTASESGSDSVMDSTGSASLSLASADDTPRTGDAANAMGATIPAVSGSLASETESLGASAVPVPLYVHSGAVSALCEAAAVQSRFWPACRDLEAEMTLSAPLRDDFAASATSAQKNGAKTAVLKPLYSRFLSSLSVCVVDRTTLASGSASAAEADAAFSHTCALLRAESAVDTSQPTQITYSTRSRSRQIKEQGVTAGGTTSPASPERSAAPHAAAASPPSTGPCDAMVPDDLTVPVAQKARSFMHPVENNCLALAESIPSLAAVQSVKRRGTKWKPIGGRGSYLHIHAEVTGPSETRTGRYFLSLVDEANRLHFRYELSSTELESSQILTNIDVSLTVAVATSTPSVVSSFLHLLPASERDVSGSTRILMLPAPLTINGATSTATFATAFSHFCQSIRGSLPRTDDGEPVRFPVKPLFDLEVTAYEISFCTSAEAAGFQKTLVAALQRIRADAKAAAEGAGADGTETEVLASAYIFGPADFATTHSLPDTFSHVAHALLYRRAVPNPETGVLENTEIPMWVAEAEAKGELRRINLPAAFPSIALSSEGKVDFAATDAALPSNSWSILTALAEVNPREIASITKCMTALLVLWINDFLVVTSHADTSPLADPARVSTSPHDGYHGLQTRIVVSEVAAAVGGTVAKVAANEAYTIQDLLMGMMLPSGNDAATALAEYFGKILPAATPADLAWIDGVFAKARHYNVEPYNAPGSPIASFVAVMNKMATRLGMEATKFANPHGMIHPGNHSNALDVCRMVACCLSDKRFREIVASTKHQCEAIALPSLKARKIRWANTNTLLGSRVAVQGYVITGVKTGITPDAAACLALSASTEMDTGQEMAARDEFVSVTLGSRNKAFRFIDNQRLVQWGAAALDLVRGSVA